MPGDPGGVRVVASVYAATAVAARDARVLVDAVVRTSGEQVWAGQAGDAFRAQVADLPGDLGACAASYETAAGALGVWAGAMADAQATADRGLEQARAAQGDLAGALRALEQAQAVAASATNTLGRLERVSFAYRNVSPPASVTVPTPGEVARARRAVTDAAGSVANANGRARTPRRAWTPPRAWWTRPPRPTARTRPRP
ncbi:putative T7SS-secreted protein [Cellulomonas hominis]